MITLLFILVLVSLAANAFCFWKLFQFQNAVRSYAHALDARVSATIKKLVLAGVGLFILSKFKGGNDDAPPSI